MTDRPRIGISTCLLGENVRYDGGHKLDRLIVDLLGPHVEWVPVCPEVECGLPIPRESMHLEGDPAAPRLVTARTHRDLTDRMLEWAARRVRELEEEDLCGYIFKSRSPSSGMTRVKVYGPNGVPQATGAGLFARAFMEHFPLLPVEEDGRLHDESIRENFIERIFCLRRYRTFLRDDGSPGGLVAFHAAHKYQLMSHSPSVLKEMGHMVAGAGDADAAVLMPDYERLLMDALRVRATPGTHANVLQHMLGYFKDRLSSGEKQEMLDVLESYRRGLVPLVVPVTLIAHYVRLHDEPYLKGQTYLEPAPAEVKLRNHA